MMAVAGAEVEGDGALVLLGDGEGEFGEAAGGEIVIAAAQQMLADAVAVEFGQGADLGDVADVVADAGAEQDSDAGLGGTVDGDEGGDRVEDSAAGKADDVVEEAERAGDGAVLVVDVAIDVSGVGGGDDGGGGLVVVFGPAVKFDLGRQRAGGLGQGIGDGQRKEEAAVAAEAFAQEGARRGDRWDG